MRGITYEFRPSFGRLKERTTTANMIAFFLTQSPLSTLFHSQSISTTRHKCSYSMSSTQSKHFQSFQFLLICLIQNNLDGIRLSKHWQVSQSHNFFQSWAKITPGYKESMCFNPPASDQKLQVIMLSSC